MLAKATPNPLHSVEAYDIVILTHHYARESPVDCCGFYIWCAYYVDSELVSLSWAAGPWPVFLNVGCKLKSPGKLKTFI